MKSIPHYIRKSGITIIRAYAMYQPLRIFSALGMLLITFGIIPGLRFVYFYIVGQRVGHIQSLILAAILIIVGFQVLLIGLVADLIANNRKMLEETLYRLRKQEFDAPVPEPNEALGARRQAGESSW
jgi:hypothetical protein